MIALALLLLAPEDPAKDLGALLRGASAKLSVADAPPPPDARYRIAGDAADPLTAQQRALAVDGGQCNVVGARLCTRKPRTLLSRPLSQ